MVAARTPRKHLAQTGKHAGEYVNCYAGIACRIGTDADHLTEAQFGAVKMWLNDQGTKKTSAQVTKTDVDGFFAGGDVLDYTTRWQTNRDRLDAADEARRADPEHARRNIEKYRAKQAANAAGERVAADVHALNQRMQARAEETYYDRFETDESATAARQLRERATATQQTTQALNVRLRIPMISVNKIMTLGSSLEEGFQELRRLGCTVTYDAKENGLISTKYYGLKIEGPERVVKNYYKWLQETA